MSKVGMLESLVSRRPRTDRALAAMALVGALIGLGVAYRRQLALVDDFRFDDAYITLRYSHELVTNGALSFNADERIDGYTSTGWALILAVAEAVGDSPVDAMLRLSSLCGFASIVAAGCLARALGARWTFAIGIASVGVLSTPGFIVWSVPGMETPFAALAFTLLLLAMSIRTNGGNRMRARLITGSRAAAFFTATLARPEGALLASMAFLPELVILRKELVAEPAWFRGAVRVHAIVATVLVGLFVWRWTYYGHPLPNTFYAKASTPGLIDRGVADAFEFLRQRAIWLAPVVALGLGASTVSPRARTVALVFAFWFICVFVVYARSGGDFPGFHRFYQPVVPAAFALIAAGLSKLSGEASSLVATGMRLSAVALAASFLVLSDHATLRTAFATDAGAIRSQTAAVDQWSRAGRALARTLPRPSRVAVRAAGALPHFARADFVYDTLALNNPTVAHENPSVRDVPAHQKEATIEQILAWRPNVIIGHPDVEPVDRTDDPPAWCDSADLRRAGFRFRCVPMEGNEHICFWQR